MSSATFISATGDCRWVPDHGAGAVEAPRAFPTLTRLYGRVSRRSALYDLGAGKNLPRGKRKIEGRRRVCREGTQRDVFTPAGRARRARAVAAHHARFGRRPEKKNYENLNVSFDVWLGESDAQAYIPTMLKIVEDKHLAVESDGALVVPVQEETDTKEFRPAFFSSPTAQRSTPRLTLPPSSSASRTSTPERFSISPTSARACTLSRSSAWRRRPVSVSGDWLRALSASAR